MARLTKAQAHSFREVLATYNHCCAGCGSPLELERDHVEPRSAGGEDAPSNLQVLCHHCNNKKNGTTDIPKFAPRQPEFDVRKILENRAVFCDYIDQCRRVS